MNHLLFVAPEMTFHYVQSHRYAPPDEFVSAVLSAVLIAPLPGTTAYRAAVEPFRDLQARRVCPEYAKWKRQNPIFPGVEKCVHLLRSQPLLRRVINWELYANASENAAALIDAFRSEPEPFIRFLLLYIMAEARLFKALPLFTEHLKSEDDLLRGASIEGLRYLGTAKARKVLLEAGLDLSHISSLLPASPSMTTSLD